MARTTLSNSPAIGSSPSRPSARGLLATRVLDARMTHYIRARACMACARLEVARCSQLQSQIPSRPKELARRRPDDGIFLAGKCLSIDCCSKLSSPSSSLKPAAVHAPGRRATRTLSTRFDYVTTQMKHHSTEGVLASIYHKLAFCTRFLLNRHAKFVSAHPDDSENDPRVSVVLLGMDQSHTMM
jgi:hypothetical protein